MLDAEQRRAEDGLGVLAEQLEWTESAGCALHDAHNSLKWSLGCQTAESIDLMKDVWSIFAALRNSYDLVVDFLAPWLQVVIDFVDDAACPPVGDMQNLWHALGVDPVMSDFLAEDLRLHKPSTCAG